NAKLKSALDNQPRTTTGQIKEKMFEDDDARSICNRLQNIEKPSTTTTITTTTIVKLPQFLNKRKSLQQISTEIQQSKPLTKREVLNLVQEIAEQPKLVEKEALRLTEDLNQKVQKATTEYQEAIQATEDIEPPAVGFAKTAYYKGGLANQVNAVIKQNNTLLYLASKQNQKLIELEEKFDRLKQQVSTVIEKEIQPADLEDSISSLAKRLDNFSISGKLPVKRSDGKIHVFEDPNKIFKEQFNKESKK
nr:hypothetical protein [Tanacetum cinerariifolium]